MLFLKIVVCVLFFASSTAMILLILLHAGKGGGLSSAFGSSVGGGYSGTQIAQKNLDRMTIASAIIFSATTIALIFIYQ